jgi:glycosyltransferase involved in cell wall biosynthesis
VRLLAFTDYVYHEQGGRIYAERAFALFLVGLRAHADELTIVGRLAPSGARSHYPLPSDVRFVPLAYYSDLTRPLAVGRSLVRSVRGFWRALDDSDCVWLLGPYPHAIVFAALVKLRRRRLVLGVRQDFPAYIRSRRPNRRWMHYGADVMETAWRILARRCAVVVVGAELAHHYSHAAELLEVTVSLISTEDIEAGERAAARSYDGPLQLLSVGRIDREKNPLLLVEVLALLSRRNPRWRLVVCGEGPLSEELVEQLDRRGLADRARVTGYVPLHDGLLELYRSSHVFLHVSLTEGMPQVITEAFASGVPVVATAVGGVPEAAGGAALLIGPDDAAAAAHAVTRVVADAELRTTLVNSGFARVRNRTREAEIARVAEFIAHGRGRDRASSEMRGGGASGDSP